MNTTHRASRFWSIPSPTKMLMPDTLSLETDRARITKRRLFGISSTNEQVLYTRIASVRVDTKVFTAEVVIETGGGATADLSIHRMKRRVARKAADDLRARAWGANTPEPTHFPGEQVIAFDTAPGWYDDPCGRHHLRWWTGVDWTNDVSDGTRMGYDLMTGTETPHASFREEGTS